MEKSGWKSSEFWVAIGMSLVPVLAAFGIVDMKDIQSIQTNWTEVMQHGSGAVVAAYYIYSRTSLKKSQADAQVKMATAQMELQSKLNQPRVFEKPDIEPTTPKE